LNLLSHLRPTTDTRIPHGFRSVSSEDWTDDEVFFPDGCRADGHSHSGSTAAPATPRRQRQQQQQQHTPASSSTLGPAVERDISIRHVPATPTRGTPRFQSPKSCHRNHT
jgi:hypothetical protein